MSIRLLDLFCGAGGAAMGYHQAGFEVVGIDNVPQPHYPFEFVLDDAFEYWAKHGKEFDVWHASPPCQGYSKMRRLSWLADRFYTRLIEPTRELFETGDKIWVIENVEGAPLAGILLCGTMFGLTTYRHRLFESNVLIPQPPHFSHKVKVGQGEVAPGGWIGTMTNNDGSTATKSKVYGIDWMTSRELSQAIPPIYTKYIGQHIMKQLVNVRDNPSQSAH